MPYEQITSKLIQDDIGDFISDRRKIGALDRYLIRRGKNRSLVLTDEELFRRIRILVILTDVEFEHPFDAFRCV